MKHLLKLVLFSATLTITGCAQQAPTEPQNFLTNDGNVNILWQNTNDYTDIEATAGVQSKFEQYLFTQLTQELGKLANKHLTEGQQLELTVTNVDLAGDVQPTFAASIDDIRVVTDLYPPKLDFEYTLRQNDKVIASGTEKLRNMSYLSQLQPLNNDTFRYEQNLLTEWFKKTIKPLL